MFYQHGLPQPYHVSVGAVVFNDDFKICTHHFTTEQVPKQLRHLCGGLSDVYHLMRESLEDGEVLEAAVRRGIQEECGATGEIEKYLGSLVCTVTAPKSTFEKTTLYHAVRLHELGERLIDDVESTSMLEWYSPFELLALYEQQAKATNRAELHEAEIIRRFIAAYNL